MAPDSSSPREVPANAKAIPAAVRSRAWLDERPGLVKIVFMAVLGLGSAMCVAHVVSGACAKAIRLETSKSHRPGKMLGGWILVTADECREMARGPAWLLLSGLAASPCVLLTWYWRDKKRRDDHKVALAERAIAEKQHRLEQETAENKHRLEQQVAFSERYTGAAQMLASENVMTRMNGLESLFDIALQAESQRPSVSRTLAAYVRTRGKTPAPRDAENSFPMADVQTAMTLLGRPEWADWDWRRPAELDLRHSNLDGVDLEAAHLKGASFIGASLRAADLSRANLVYAVLSKAHLELANLDNAHLESGDLERAHLQDSSFEGAHLENAQLQEANLNGASMFYAHLQDAMLAAANLKGANLSHAHLERACLSDAHLEGALLQKAHLRSADLTNAHLERADLGGAHLDEAKLAGAFLLDANLGGADLSQTDLQGARLEGARYHDARWGSNATKFPVDFDPHARTMISVPPSEKSMTDSAPPPVRKDRA